MILLTSYEDIYGRFAQKITDFKMLEMNDEDVRDMMNGWMKSAIAKFRRCQHDLSDRDDDLEEFSFDLLDIELEILAELMVGEWLAPQLNSVLYTSQFFGGKEEKFYAQANQLDKLLALQRRSEIRAQKLMRDYGYQNRIWSSREG